MALASAATASPWDLEAEAVAVKIRWFGLIVGWLYVHLVSHAEATLPLNAILALGGVYTLLDTWYSYRGRVFLGGYPLAISLLEAIFIGLLCYYDGGLDSVFRFYYLLSLICCAIRHPLRITYLTCGLDCISYSVLYLALPAEQREPFRWLLMLLILAWVTGAAGALSRLIRQAGEQLEELNRALRENQALLEARIEERTRQLQETQAQMLHQEKMAAFGLLAAGIAHEVGNPLASISSLVQMLERRDSDDYTRERLHLLAGQLRRIQGILRELIQFSRPANSERTRFRVHEIVEEALNIAKYYKGTKSRTIRAEVPPELPPLWGKRDQLVQVMFNLILNAIDATQKNGTIVIAAQRDPAGVLLSVQDDGMGIPPEHQPRLFQPYFTTKKTGTGLGLFVTAKIVQEHGGTVEFESQPQRGTIFRIRLPSADSLAS